MTYKQANLTVNIFIIFIILAGILLAILDGKTPEHPSYEADPKEQMRQDRAEMEFQPW